MTIIVHVTRASAAAGIRKNGIRATRCSLTTSDGVADERGVFAFPVLESFAQTYQWVRELRRHHDERVIAVYVKARDDEEVLVGRYGQVHQRTNLGEAIRWIRTHPWGAQVLLPRRIAAREVHAVRAITQLVGWTGAPHDTALADCVCAMCLPTGSRDITRKVRAAFQKQVRLARDASDPAELVRALRGMDMPLERIGSRVGIKPLLGFARHPEVSVRTTVAWALGYCRSDALVTDRLVSMMRDVDDEVAAAAAQSLLGITGRSRFLQAAATMSEAALLEVVDHLEYVPTGRAVLERLGATSDVVQARIAETLSRLAKESG